MTEIGHPIGPGERAKFLARKAVLPQSEWQVICEERMADTAYRQAEAPATPAAEELAARIQAKFRQGVADAVQQAHNADLPVPVLGDDGRVAWLHPDGVVRAVRDIHNGEGQG